MTKILKFIFSRTFIIPLLMLVQFAFVLLLVFELSQYAFYFYFLFYVLSFIVILGLLSTSDNPSYKLAWTILILGFPLFGWIIYLIFGVNSISPWKRRRMNASEVRARRHSRQDMVVASELQAADPDVYMQSKYILDTSAFPVHKNTVVDYFPLGDSFWLRLMKELEKAKHYIFMEFFIVEAGQMWNPILEILERKVKEGLDVRFMYDDVGSLNTLPANYFKQLEKRGIKSVAFNSFQAFLYVKFNNRDHRKIVIIDGYVGFTGGINLADEYINAYEKHGHWKDTAVMLKGDAVWNLTVMFLRLWNLSRPTDNDFSLYMPKVYHPQAFESDGYVQPYGSTPLSPEPVGEHVYLNLMNHAKKYLYITTPYLIVGHEMMTALALAARSGVDVRIITPHVADKWYVHLLTQASYGSLINAGVRIYEYTPGFIHAKMFVSDDKIATVGTVNLDYRSFYLHYECGVLLYKNKVVNDVYYDFMATLEQSHEITLEETKKVPWYKRVVRSVLRLFAPLM